MNFVSLSFLSSLLFLAFFVTNQVSAKPGNSKTKPIKTKKCNNIYFYEAPNKKMETMLKDIKKQLAHMQTDINILKGKQDPKGKVQKYVEKFLLLANPNQWSGFLVFSRLRETVRCGRRRWSPTRNEMAQVLSHLICLFLQLRGTVLSFTNLVKKSAEFTPSTLMVQVPSMSSVTKPQPVEDGQCSKRDWMAPLISTAAGLTTRMASVTRTESFGWGSIR